MPKASKASKSASGSTFQGKQTAPAQGGNSNLNGNANANAKTHGPDQPHAVPPGAQSLVTSTSLKKPRELTKGNSTFWLFCALVVLLWFIKFSGVIAYCLRAVFDEVVAYCFGPVHTAVGQLFMNAGTYYSELIGWALSYVIDTNMFFTQSVVTCGALSWLLHRAWQTLWKPVPELISILGVEVQDAPEVSLAGIKTNAVTLHWTRPGANKPVTKYLIQINGVNVGESSRTETAITVTGLKPSHFYNVRVIAVGSNNFQSGSKVIRLRTYGRDGRPLLANRSFSLDLLHDVRDDSEDNSPTVRSHGVGIEAVSIAQATPAMARESSSRSGQQGGSVGQQGQRRSTATAGGRKHSPSTGAADQANVANSSNHEESMPQLTERFEAIRKETEDILMQNAREAQEFKAQYDELLAERDEKKQILKEKEEASEKLRKEVHSLERANRQAQNWKAQKEKVLRDKQAERSKMEDDINRWKKEMERMKTKEESWRIEKEKLEKDRESKSEGLRNTIRQRQQSLSGLEEEIRVKGLQIKGLEEERRKFPGFQDNEESRKREAADKQRDQEWESKERERQLQIHNYNVRLRSLEVEYHRAQATANTLRARQESNPLIYQGNSSGVDFNTAGGQAKVKPRKSRNRKSRTNTISSPMPGFRTVDSSFPSASPYNNLNNTASPSYPHVTYFDIDNTATMVPHASSGMSEADINALTAGAPLSPTATSLLPSNIFADEEPSTPRPGSAKHIGQGLFGVPNPSPRKNDPQSPASSSRSASLISSPRNSSHNLTMHSMTGRVQGTDNDRRSLNSPRADYSSMGSSSTSNPVSQRNLSGIFNFPKTRGKTMDDGPAFGSLKQGQSQSFPTEESEAMANRPRRISFSTGWNIPNFLTRSPVGEANEGNAPVPARNVSSRHRRGFNMFSQSVHDATSMHSDRDPSSPRPVSIASLDFPKPSTDSAPFGWPVTDSGSRNSPLTTDWSSNIPQSWSSQLPRKASGIASEDDEFLPPETLTALSSPPPVGVIGTRPTSSHKPVSPKLNPTAPTFKAMFNRGSIGDKGKGKENAEQLMPSEELMQATGTSSSGEPRKSRDARSIGTQDSVAESGDGLEATPSDPSDTFASGSAAKDKESSLRQLLRKGSSSKFSFSSIRSKDSGLFSGKRGSGSAANSDQNTSQERDNSFDAYGGEPNLGRSVDSITSSPTVGDMGSDNGKGKESPAIGASREAKAGVNWGRFGRKKKGRESSDVERSEAETTGTEDEEGETMA